ncbi:PEP-CTERM sorting domain-containing protein [Crocosphaera sp.]|nr:PEP-CTERM sorting domain-containing protein [Crocosphaera sp.]MDJ0581207.1 PEP-CTERM sorting domain-containing protein [Crocosphaera sp.]
MCKFIYIISVDSVAQSVPEPSTIISLAMVGGSLLLSKRVKRG